MEYLNITKQTSYESVKDEFYTLVENEFEDTLWRSYHSWNEQHNFSSPLKNICKNTDAYSSKVFENLQKSFIGEAASKVQWDSYFENFDSLLGQDDSLANYSDDLTTKRSAEPEVKNSWLTKTVNTTFQKPSDVYTGRVDVVNKSILRMIKSLGNKILICKWRILDILLIFMLIQFDFLRNAEVITRTLIPP